MTREELLAIKAQAEKLTRDDPSSADAWRNLAQAKMMLGDFDGAIDDCVSFDQLPPEKVKAIAIEIAMFGTNGIAPDREYEKPLKNLPGESFTGNRLLAWYYVSWKYAFPDQLHLVGLPFDSAYELAMTLRGPKGE